MTYHPEKVYVEKKRGPSPTRKCSECGTAESGWDCTFCGALDVDQEAHECSAEDLEHTVHSLKLLLSRTEELFNRQSEELKTAQGVIAYLLGEKK